MRISELFQLHLTQPELDFVDIDIEKDMPLFLDPFFLSKRTDRWSFEANRTLQSFFQKVLDLIRSGHLTDARKLFDHFIEPNETCLGLSKGSPQGRGVGQSYADDVFTQLIQSKAVQTGLIQDIQDNVIFVDGFGKDRLSDMSTVLLKKHLIDYTKNQCNYHGIKLTPNQQTGYYWNSETQEWDQDITDLLIIEGRHIILVPKGIVSFSKIYTSQRFYQHYVLNFLRHDYIQIKSALVQYRADGTPFITKKTLKEVHPYNKDFLRKFTENNPSIFEKFKSQERIDSLHNSEIADFDLHEIKEHLKSVLVDIPPGRDSADIYHRHIKSIMEFLFYPLLITPVLENKIHDGRKRVDITFDNAATSGIFFNLANQYQLPCQFIMVECKNYVADPTNPELDQLAGRFSPNRGKVGLLLCRSFRNIELFLERCKDTYIDQRGLIIPIVDEDLVNLLDNYDENNFAYLDSFLRDRIKLIAI